MCIPERDAGLGAFADSEVDVVKQFDHVMIIFKIKIQYIAVWR
jgi:hypothetical protein